LLRIHVKLSKKDATTKLDAIDAFSKLEKTSEKMAAMLQSCTRRTVRVCNVLWSTQNIPLAQLSALRAKGAHVVYSDNMLDLLDAPTRKFVNENTLAHFGWTE
jgi:hypothetical protein